ncbi:MAG: hypothetical protein S4CHLAM45_08150 [Chlamydiales bacterium]|nr:hypothetical protein [Chlamydiales bacterium]MCH9620433.1 hypothetical protein [Chlamydiales bacterium]MCH9622921.1 hypothetical protein [Chlamydiales bacterium]
MKTQLKWILPLLFLAVIAPFTPTLDLKIASFFFNGETFSQHPYFTFLFKTGELFGFFIGAVVLFVYLVSWVSRRARRYRQGALAIGLTLLLGAGIIVNEGFKKYWGRPRPKQIEQFGGKLSYRPFWQPNLDREREPQKSFPSGHVSMGFFYLSFIIVGRRYKNQAMFFTGIFLTIFWGGGLMLARMAQGGHFLSDVLVAPVVMWWTLLIIAKFTLGEPLEESLSKERRDIGAKSDPSQTAAE